MKNIISEIRKALKQKIDPVYKKGSLNFFKEPIKLYGVKHSETQKITNHFFKQIKDLKIEEQLKIIEELFKSNFNEEFSIGADWLYCLTPKLNKNHFSFLEKIVKNNITNWGMCDDFCTHSLGFLIYRYPELISKTKPWLKNTNRWVKRASAVYHIHPTKKGSLFQKEILKNPKKYLQTIFNIADNLMEDPDDLVQKGYGWMLKEAANLFPEEIFKYVFKNKAKMRRTALRYAIEKMPKTWKTKAMN